MSNEFLITEKFSRDIGNEIWDIFPIVHELSPTPLDERVLDFGKIAMVNLNVSFNYINLDNDPGIVSLTGTEVIKVLITSKNFITGSDETDLNNIFSCPLIVTSKNDFSSVESYGNQQNFFFKVFLKEGQKITVIFKNFAGYHANFSVHCAGRITDEINYE